MKFLTTPVIFVMVMGLGLASAQEADTEGRSYHYWFRGTLIPPGDPVPGEFSGALGFNYETKVLTYLAFGFGGDLGLLRPGVWVVQADVGMRVPVPLRENFEPYLRVYSGGTGWFTAGDGSSADFGGNLQLLVGGLLKLERFGLFGEGGVMLTQIAHGHTVSYLLSVGGAF